MAKEAKKYFVTVDEKDVEVSEETYRAYKQPLWREHKRIERSQKCDLGKKRCDKKCDTCPYSKQGAPLSLDTMFEDGLDVPDGNNLEDMIELKMTIEALHRALDQLDPDDRDIKRVSSPETNLLLRRGRQNSLLLQRSSSPAPAWRGRRRHRPPASAPSPQWSQSPPGQGPCGAGPP
jgi:hypothetical protein